MTIENDQETWTDPAYVTRVLEEGDPRAIKQIYVDYGDDMWKGHAEGRDEVPLLSYPGTPPIVADALAGVSGRILDAGCGPNPLLSMLLASASDRSVVALDIAYGTVRTALAVAGSRELKLHGVVADVEALPFRPGVFDGVACDDTIEHLPDDRMGAVELHRVSVPDATVVIATPNRHSLKVLRRKVVDRLHGRRHPASHYFVTISHVREYSWRECARVLEPVLDIRHRAGVPFETGRRGHVTRLINVLVTRRPFHRLSPMIVLVTSPRGQRT